jgi:hypothetical protein
VVLGLSKTWPSRTLCSAPAKRFYAVVVISDIVAGVPIDERKSQIEHTVSLGAVLVTSEQNRDARA